MASVTSSGVGSGDTAAPSPGRYITAAGISPGATAMAAAMRARAARLAKSLEKPQEVIVLYGSQTGNAMEIAKSLSAEAQSKGIPSKALAMQEFSLTKLENTSIAIFVVSSTGDGDPPDNCESMFNSIRRKTHPSNLLSKLNFTVLGLGDSNFTRFMHVSRVFRKRLVELGAKPFYKFGEADEVEGLEDAVDSWLAGLWESLKDLTKKSSTISSPTDKQMNKPTALESPPTDSELPPLVGVPALQPCRIKLAWQDAVTATSASHDKEQKTNSDANHVLADVSDARVMTSEGSDRKVIHVELKNDGCLFSNMKAGDSIGVVPVNNDVLVDRLISRLNAVERKGQVFEAKSNDNDQPTLLHIKQPCSLRHAFLHHCDITSVLKKGLIRTLAESCENEKEKHRMLFLCSRGGKDAYKTEVQDAKLGIVDFLDLFPSCHPPLPHVFDHLPPLVPRLYSLSNSPSAKGGEKVQVAFSVVRMTMGVKKEKEQEKERMFEGVCTTWFERKLGLDRSRERGPAMEGVKIPIFLKSGGSFHPPSSLSSPLIMIGPGTGVSPFRGFLQEREKLMEERKKIGGREGEAEGKHLQGDKDQPVLIGKGEREEGHTEGESGGDVSPSWLFFGCRREDEDYLYKEDLENFHKKKVLSHLVVAFSRETEEKVYVQDKLKLYGEEITSLLLNPRTHVYVCGDGAKMAKDVHSTLLLLLEKHANKKEGLGILHLNDMMNQNRYVRDIWS